MAEGGRRSLQLTLCPGFEEQEWGAATSSELLHLQPLLINQLKGLLSNRFSRFFGMPDHAIECLLIPL